MILSALPNDAISWAFVLARPTRVKTHYPRCRLSQNGHVCCSLRGDLDDRTRLRIFYCEPVAAFATASIPVVRALTVRLQHLAKPAFSVANLLQLFGPTASAAFRPWHCRISAGPSAATAIRPLRRPPHGRHGRIRSGPWLSLRPQGGPLYPSDRNCSTPCRQITTINVKSFLRAATVDEAERLGALQVDCDFDRPHRAGFVREASTSYYCACRTASTGSRNYWRRLLQSVSLSSCRSIRQRYAKPLQELRRCCAPPPSHAHRHTGQRRMMACHIQIRRGLARPGREPPAAVRQ
jgi:hypothetical protein